MPTTNENSPTLLSRFSMRGDINGLAIVLVVLVALMLLPRPSEAEYKRSDVLMNDMILVDDFNKRR